MIINFEQYTKRVNAEDQKVIQFIANVLSKTVKDYPMKSDEIVLSANSLKEFYNFEGVVKGHDVRRCVNYIRRNAILPVIATSKGYYCSYDMVELQKNIQGLKERAGAIIAAAEGLEEVMQNTKQCQHLN